MFLVFLDYHLRYKYAEIEYIWGKGKIKTQGDTLKAKESGAECRGDALTTELIPGDSFFGGSYNFLSFCFKETHAWFCADYLCISYGVEICPCRCGIPGIRIM